jgi:hypothetical protein
MITAAEMLLQAGSEQTTEQLGDNKSALERINTEPAYRPLNSLVTEDIAAEAEKHLSSLIGCGIGPKYRAATLRIINFLCEIGNYTKNKSQMMKEVGLPVQRLYHIERKWSGFWRFVNLIVQRMVVQGSMARVVTASTEAAIHGNDRDRRLYFEAFTGLSKKQSMVQAGTINFIQNVMERPTPELSPGPEEPVMIDVALVDRDDG